MIINNENLHSFFKGYTVNMKSILHGELDKILTFDEFEFKILKWKNIKFTSVDFAFNYHNYEIYAVGCKHNAKTQLLICSVVHENQAYEVKIKLTSWLKKINLNKSKNK